MPTRKDDSQALQLARHPSHLLAKSTKDTSNCFVGYARPQRQPDARIRGVP
jgi:hypothetical protein